MQGPGVMVGVGKLGKGTWYKIASDPGFSKENCQASRSGEVRDQALTPGNWLPDEASHPSCHMQQHQMDGVPLVNLICFIYLSCRLPPLAETPNLKAIHSRSGRANAAGQANPNS